MVVVGVLSGKGGVGKTTISTNLAVALSKFYHRKVLVLDCNPGSSHISLHFGIPNNGNNFMKLFEKKTKPESLVTKHIETGVDIISAPTHFNEVVLKNLKKLKKVIYNLAFSSYDFLILDGPPGFWEDVKSVIRASDKILIVTTPHKTSVEDARKIISLAKKMKKKHIFVLINRVKRKKYELDYWEIRKMLNVPIVGVIPEDSKLEESVNLGSPAVLKHPNSLVSIVFRKVASVLVNEFYNFNWKERIKLKFAGLDKYFY